MTQHSAHYPTFIEHPEDPEKRSLVKTPWLHHKQLLAWGLEGLTPEPEPPAGDPSNKPAHDPIYPKWIENPKTQSRKLVANAKDEAAQLLAWGIDVDDDEDDDKQLTPGYSGPTPLEQITTGNKGVNPLPKNAGTTTIPVNATVGNGGTRPPNRDERRAAAKKQREAEANAAAGRK